MNRTTAIAITVAIIVLCACPGLFSMLMGGMFAVISFMPGAESRSRTPWLLPALLSLCACGICVLTLLR